MQGAVQAYGRTPNNIQIPYILLGTGFQSPNRHDKNKMTLINTYPFYIKPMNMGALGKSGWNVGGMLKGCS